MRNINAHWVKPTYAERPIPAEAFERLSNPIVSEMVLLRGAAIAIRALLVGITGVTMRPDMVSNQVYIR